MVQSLFGFLAVSVFLILVPGQDVATVTRSALAGDRVTGVFTALGIATGLAVWSIAAALGLAALLRASEPAFLALKLVGTAYLVFIGLQSLYAAFRGKVLAKDTGTGSEERALATAAAFRQGVLSNLGNPKIAVFFTSFLPQFTGRGGATTPALLLLGFTYCILSGLWLCCYAMVVARSGAFLRRPRVSRIVSTVTGFVLIAFGLRLATERP